MQQKASLFEVKALAYWNLRKFYKHVRGSYKVECIGGRRLDIVIFKDNGDVALVLEVKRTKRCKSEKNGYRYSMITGVPCLSVKGMQEAYDVVRTVKGFLGW